MRAWSLLFVGFTACGTNTSSDAGSPDASAVVTCNTPEPLSACTKGWQFSPPASPCPCSVNNKPECAHADCQELDVTGWLDGGVEIEGIIYYSAEAGTMSTWSAVLQGQWSLADGGIFESLSGGKVACATCDSAGGVCYLPCNIVYAMQIPASAGWSASLNAALAAGNTWTAWPVTP